MNAVGKHILQFIKKNKKSTMRELVVKFGFSRIYINRLINQLIANKQIIRTGQTSRVNYLPFNMVNIKSDFVYKKKLYNHNISEDGVLKSIRAKSSIFDGLKKRVINILNYAFLEMLNNAIEHSKSKNIRVEFKKLNGKIEFEIKDNGVGIYNNIINKNNLKNQFEAIQELFKGKQTTDPKNHSGQGIFFTSKVADMFKIISGNKTVTVDNCMNDMFITNNSHIIGTRIIFSIIENSKKQISELFNAYSGRDYKFDKTDIKVKLFQFDRQLLSRSQARRILIGLDDFDRILLDFKGVETVGQGFADEIVRVYASVHPNKRIQWVNTNENIEFMLRRALAG